MKAIIVATPLQLFNAIIIMRHFYPHEKCDLFVLDIACNMRPVIRNYQNLDVIGDIYYLDNLCQRTSRIGILWDHIYTSQSHRKVLSDISNKKYTDLLTTWVGRASTWLFTKLLKKSPGMNIHFYEEGIGVYTQEIYSIYNGIKEMYKLLNYKYEADYAKNLFVYQPALCGDLHSGLNKIKIGDILESDIAYMSDLIQSSRVNPYTCDAIYFENDFRNTVFQGLDENIIIDNINKAIPKEKLVIRMHPRSPHDKYDQQHYIIDTNVGVSWEDIVAVNNSNLDNVLLLSTISTAVFSPKLYYGKEPVIFMLGKAIKNEFKGTSWADAFWDQSIESFTCSFQSLYNNKERVVVPENFNEMVSLLNKYRIISNQ